MEGYDYDDVVMLNMVFSALTIDLLFLMALGLAAHNYTLNGG